MKPAPLVVLNGFGGTHTPAASDLVFYFLLQASAMGCGGDLQEGAGSGSESGGRIRGVEW